MVNPFELLATAVQGKWRMEDHMIQRVLFLHYRQFRDALAAMITIGTALLLSYLNLWLRL
jgi:hypothetical protein